MARQNAYVDREWARTGSPSNTANVEESVPRWAAASDLTAPASGSGIAAGVPLSSGDVVGRITLVTGATAAATPTQQHVALYSPTGAALLGAVGAGSTARAANTAYTFVLPTPVTVTSPGLYLVDFAMAAGTVCTLRGASVGNAAFNAALSSGLPLLSGTHASAIPATATVSSSVRASNVVTTTTSAGHGFAVGDTVVVNGQTTDATMNGTVVVASVPSSTTFTFASTGTAGTDSSGGAAYKVPSSIALTANAGIPYFVTAAS